MHKQVKMAGQYRSQYFVLGSPSAVSGLDHVFHCSEIVIEFCELAHDFIFLFFLQFFLSTITNPCLLMIFIVLCNPFLNDILYFLNVLQNAVNKCKTDKMKFDWRIFPTNLPFSFLLQIVLPCSTNKVFMRVVFFVAKYDVNR